MTEQAVIRLNEKDFPLNIDISDEIIMIQLADSILIEIDRSPEKFDEIITFLLTFKDSSLKLYILEHLFHTKKPISSRLAFFNQGLRLKFFTIEDKDNFSIDQIELNEVYDPFFLRNNLISEIPSDFPCDISIASRKDESSWFLSSNPPAICYAAFFHSNDIVEYFISKGCPFNITDNNEMNLFHFAIAGNNGELLKLLSDQYGVPNGSLHIAALFNRKNIFEWLLNEKKQNIEDTFWIFGDVLGFCAAANSIELAKICLSKFPQNNLNFPNQNNLNFPNQNNLNFQNQNNLNFQNQNGIQSNNNSITKNKWNVIFQSKNNKIDNNLLIDEAKIIACREGHYDMIKPF